MWMSVPQIAVRFTRIFTSFGPASGSGTSSSQSPRLASRLTSAFNGLSFDAVSAILTSRSKSKCLEISPLSPT
jgi:hypothetical protein